jgi:hypothetical protein
MLRQGYNASSFGPLSSTINELMRRAAWTHKLIQVQLPSYDYVYDIYMSFISNCGCRARGVRFQPAVEAPNTPGMRPL